MEHFHKYNRNKIKRQAKAVVPTFLTYPCVKMGNECVQEVGLSHHIAVKDDQELPRSPFVQNGIVQVPGLGVVGLAHLLDSSEVPKDDVVATRPVFLPHRIDQGADLIPIFTIIANVDRDLVNGVINMASGNQGVSDNLDRLRVTRNQYVDGGFLRVGNWHIRKAFARTKDPVPDHKIRDEEA